MHELTTLLNTQRYAGRGIIMGVMPSGAYAFAYFIMGRSASSRARRFFADGDNVVIKNIGGDPEHPELIIYSPVRRMGRRVIVTNGDQTDTVYEALHLGGSFESALQTRCFEPDPPHFTSRISGIIDLDGGYELSILKAADGTGTACKRQFFSYERMPGRGHYIHTYSGTEHRKTGDVLMPFAGEPHEVALPDDINTFAEVVWNGIDNDNKVALCVETFGKDGHDRVIINKY